MKNTPAQPMRELELREFAVCDICRKKIGESRIPFFYKVSVETHHLDGGAIQRKTGLELVTGSPLLATVLGPDEPMTTVPGGCTTVSVCYNCAVRNGALVALIPELANTPAKEG